MSLSSEPLPIGPRVVNLLEVAYRARRPVLLEGPTGIGKSQITAEVARRLGLDYLVLDLSLLEPPDLIGLPVIREGRTHYASPSELPVGGRGILMLEELNRAEIPVMQPALQLLSARRLHAYELPPGWTCVAAINPEDQDYQVHRLDPALRSRFLQLNVCAERRAWMPWALGAQVHSAVLQVVERHEDAFAVTSPRSWVYASDLLHTLRPAEVADADLVRSVLRGYLPEAWVLVTVDALRELPVLDWPQAEVLWSDRGPQVLRQFTASLRLDEVAALSVRLQSYFREVPDGVELSRLEALVRPLPGDLAELCLETAALSPSAPALLRGSGLSWDRLEELCRHVAQWREQLLVYRIHMAVTAVMAGLRSQPDALPAAPLQRLAEEAGPPGDVVVRWLRARGH